MDEGADENSEGWVLNSLPNKHAYKMQAKTPKPVLKDTRSNISSAHQGKASCSIPCKKQI